MSFLQPMLLFSLPLVLLPVLIHLINRQRHHTKRWAAMQFLLSAKRMSRGMARLRHLLIMAMRMLAVAGLIFAVSRPLVSGWLGFAIGGRPNTILVLLDRSASMEQVDPQTGKSKRTRGLEKLADLSRTLGGTTRVVFIESTECVPREIDSPENLLEMPAASGTATTADIPKMLQAAADYIVANETGRTDVWVCSDLRQNDWDDGSGRWAIWRDSLTGIEGVRWHLLTYADPPTGNLSVWVSNVQLRQLGEAAELVFDIRVRRQHATEDSMEVPLIVEINGNRSQLDVEINGTEFARQGHVVPLDKATEQGWASVRLPADPNPQDNVFYFAFAKPPEHRTYIITEDVAAAAPFRLAAETAVDPAIKYSAEVLKPNELNKVDWTAAAMLIWQAALPDEIGSRQLEAFVASGRTLIFFPPEVPNANSAFGFRWQAWETAAPETPWGVANDWRSDSDLLSNTLSGAALPVGDLKAYQFCLLEGSGSVLARFDTGQPLLTRATTDSGAVYFCATLPRASHSSMARDGVVFYVMLQRGLASGAAALGQARQLAAGDLEITDLTQWSELATDVSHVASSARPLHAGVFQRGDELVAINRPPGEDLASSVDVDALGPLFGGLDYTVVSDTLTGNEALASEIWRAFLVVMILALVLEAAFCLADQQPARTPDPVEPPGARSIESTG